MTYLAQPRSRPAALTGKHFTDAVCVTSIEWNTATRRFRAVCTCSWSGEARFVQQIKQKAAGHVRIVRRKS